MDQESQTMNLIVNAGNARSLAMEAIAKAKAGRPEEAAAKIKAGETALSQAHEQQTVILEDSLEDPELKISMLMAHAQDHLMNAITVLDMAREFCDLYKLLYEKINGGSK
jgi:PTS system cellobiose-specific IIA component